jgi:Txe/YoeB family toxin of Txe-Axe toxin-antitoxin module
MTDIEKEEQIRDLRAECERLTAVNGEKDNRLNQFKLVMDAVQAQKHENEFIKEFKQLIENDYRQFAREENSLPNEVDMVEQIQTVQSDLERLINFPALHSKTVGAIAGGFSSGKSTFINSFFMEKTVRLAVAVKPSTAIPSYVVCGEKPEITGYNKNGACFSIEPDVYKSITHDSMKKLDFDLREIIPYITVSCPMDKALFENICFIDTPGYNAPAIGSAEKDKSTAAASIESANFLIWLAGLDTTGTIDASDIDFLKQDTLPFGKGGSDGRDLYIVLNNKTGAKNRNQLENILDSVEDILKNAGLAYAGMCGYDPCDKKDELHLFRKIDLFDFIKTKNKPNVNMDMVYQPLSDVLEKYRFYLQKDEQSVNRQKSLLQQIKRDVYTTLPGNRNTENMDTQFSELQAMLDTGEFTKHLAALKTLRMKFDACFIGISNELGIKWQPKPLVRRKTFCNKCGRKLEGLFKFCPACGESTILEEK